MTREEAITRLKVYRDYLCKMSSWFDVNEVAKPFNMAIEALEVKRGEWRYGENDIGLDGYWCTVCGKFVLWDYKESIDFIHRYNYCPNCGADMRGDDDE